jgi:acyl carrier protein
MWLLDVRTLQLEEFFGSNIPPYAILSHTWGTEEVSFIEMKKPKYRMTAQRKAGFAKIEGCCIQAQRDGLSWAWVDSCCIDKRSSALLQEAINSMFQWYRLSSRCYVHLSDVPSGSEAVRMLGKAQWFTRGWTLQELLAPQKMMFFAQDWIPIGYKTSFREEESQLLSPNGYAEKDKVYSYANLTEQISTTTNIPIEFLIGKKGLSQACVAQRMFWASRRITTRAEDRAYSLMGLFDISMPILYGEGLEKAFTRLQREIISRTTDQSILVWYRREATSYRLLAESPDCFQNSGSVMQLGRRGPSSAAAMTWSSFSMTNLGLRIMLPVATKSHISSFDFGDSAEATLHCVVDDDDGDPRRISLCLLFLKTDLEGRPIFMCHRRRNWTFSIGDAPPPIRMFLYGNDFTSEQKIFRPANVQVVLDLESRFLDILADEIGFSREELVDDMSLTELGADSLLFLTISYRIQEEIGTDINHGIFMKYPTIGELKTYCGFSHSKPIYSCLEGDKVNM